MISSTTPFLRNSYRSARAPMGLKRSRLETQKRANSIIHIITLPQPFDYSLDLRIRYFFLDKMTANFFDMRGRYDRK